MPRHNDQTLSSFKKLKADLAQTAARGYSVDLEEDELGMCCIGAPIFDSLGDTCCCREHLGHNRGDHVHGRKRTG